MHAKLNTYDMERVPLWKAVPLRTPFLLGIEPTFACNFKCNYCMHSLSVKELADSRGWESAPMEWDTFQTILRQMGDFPDKFKKVTFAGDGEPFLNPELADMIRAVADSNRAEKTLVITNGALLSPKLTDSLLASGLNELKISMQGISSAAYKEICGADIDFDEFVRNIEYFYANRGNTKLSLKIADSALKRGEEKLFYERFGNLCDNIAIEHIYAEFHGVDYNAGVLPNEGKNRFGYDYRKTLVCGEQFFKISVLRSGEITFGCPDGVTFEGFNVHNMTLHNAWNSKELRTFLYDHLSHRLDRHPQCINCRRWDYSVVPEDMIDGHETEILAKLSADAWDFSNEYLRKETIYCYYNSEADA
jgi:pyruvate-formate lyase-activating enzyme